MSAPRRLDWLAALPVAALGGFALNAATPAPSWWPMAFLGAALVIAAVWQQRVGIGALAGAVAGAAFWLPQIEWLTLYLGPIPWLALSTVMTAWFVLFGAAAATATRGLAQLKLNQPSVPVVLVVAAQSLAVAGLWVFREQLQSVWPYGGFAWGRLAHTQAEGPLVHLVSWMGFSGLSGLIALACAVPVAVAYTMAGPTSPGRSRLARPLLAAGGAGAIVALALAPLALVPAASLQETGTIRIAAVQGNSQSGIFDDRENGDVFRSHFDATVELLDELDANNQSVDVIVWPENSAEFDLPNQPYRLLAVQRLAERASAPIVVGTVLHDETDGVDTYTNSTMVIDAEGDTGLRYDKRRPVPFAEYMPNRAFFHALVPDLVDLVQLDYQAGTRSAVLDIDLGDGNQNTGPQISSVSAGIAICFDIIFDDHAVAMMNDGAEIIFAQTNNADFGRTEESAQQLQIARLRAVEMGRTLVNISTVGTSAIVLPDGSDAASLETHVAGSMIAEVPLVTGATPALKFGAVIAAIWMLLGGGGVIAGTVILLLNRSARSKRLIVSRDNGDRPDG